MKLQITIEIDGTRPEPFRKLRYIWLPGKGGPIKTRIWRWWYERELSRGGEVCLATHNGPCYIPTIWGESYCAPHWYNEPP